MEKCEKCTHDICNLITKVSGYYELYIEDLEINDLKKLGQAINELVDFVKDKNKFYKFDI